MIAINFSNIKYLTEDYYRIAINLLPDNMKDQVRSYAKDGDRKRCLLGKLLLQHSLMALYNNCNILSDIRLDNHRRPYLNDRLDFNISHSGNYVVCALSDETKVGIDIENVQPIDFWDIKDLVLNEMECFTLNEAQWPLEYFYNIWTIKEAALKASGIGLISPVRDIQICRDYVICLDKSWKYKCLFIDPDYRCHFVYNGNGHIQLYELKVPDLLPPALIST